MDVLPTTLDLAGVRHPAPLWHGRAIHAPRGRTWLPWLRGTAAQPHDDAGDFHGWELFGQQAVRQGTFKALFIPPPEGPGRWQLFDLAHDPAEAHDLAPEQPQRLASLLQVRVATATRVQLVLTGSGAGVGRVRARGRRGHHRRRAVAGRLWRSLAKKRRGPSGTPALTAAQCRGRQTHRLSGLIVHSIASGCGDAWRGVAPASVKCDAVACGGCSCARPWRACRRGNSAPC
jgi:hypothetical protein